MIQQNVYFSLDSKQIVYYNISVNKMFIDNIKKGDTKMRKFLSSVLALLMLISAFSCLTVTGFAADTVLTEKEKNDEAATANDIKVAETNVGALQTNKDVDWYKFTSDKDYFTVDFGYLNISDKDGLSYAWKVTIYNEKLETIKCYDGYYSFSSPEFPITGTIYVKVEAEYLHNNDIVNIPYVITSKTYTDSQWEDEYNNSSSDATLMTNNQQYIGALQEANDVDWYKFTSDKDYFIVDFGFQNISDKDGLSYAWKVTIYNEKLETIKCYDGYYSFSSPEFPITGTIYVKVEAEYLHNNDIVNIPYVITSKTYTDSQWEDEYNNQSTTANKIEQGKKYKATLYNANDVDFFKFKATSDAFNIKISVDLNETSVEAIRDGWKLTIYPSDSASSIVGNYTVSSIGSFETRVLPYEKDKEYFIKFQANNSNKAPVDAIYNFEVIDATDGKNWEVENGGTDMKYATTVTNNKVVYGNLYSYNDLDYYKYTVHTDGTINFTFNRDESDKTNGGWNLYLKDAAGNTVYSTTVNGAIKYESEKISVKKGNYYLLVRSYYSNNAPSSDINYNIQLNYAMHTPKISKLSNTAKGVSVQWGGTAGVENYILYRREYNATTKKWTGWKAIAKPSASATSYVDTTAKSGVKYRYTIKGVYGTLSSAFVSAGDFIRLAQPKTTVKTVSNGVNVAWTQSAGATGYTVYRSEYNAKTKKWSGWKNMGTTKKTAKSWTDKSAKKGVYYKYTVRAVNGSYASGYTASGKVKR